MSFHVGGPKLSEQWGTNGTEWDWVEPKSVVDQTLVLQNLKYQV